MATAGSLDYFIRSIYQGGAGIAAAMKDIGGLGTAAKQTDLQMGMARENSRKYGAAVRALSKDVSGGKISMEAAEAKLKTMRTELGIGEQTTRKSGFAFTELKSKIDIATQAVGAAGQVFATTWKLIGEGAQLEIAESRFEKLAGSIGANSGAMLAKFEEATGGMMSRAQMIGSASQIISLGLAGNADDVVRLGNVVGQLGLDMNQVIMTFANDSEKRLDALGLSIADVEARTKGYTDAGMDASKAFDLAVLDALEAKLSLLGSAAGTTAGSMQVLESSWTNLTDRGKQWLAQRWEGPIVGLATTIDAAGDASDRGHSKFRNLAVVLNELTKATGGVSGDALIDWMDRGAKTAEDLTDKVTKAGQAIEEGMTFTAASFSGFASLEQMYARQGAATAESSRLFRLQQQEAVDAYAVSLHSAGSIESQYATAAQATAAASQQSALRFQFQAEQAAAAAEATRLINQETASFFNQLAGNEEMAAEYAAILGQTGETTEGAATSTELLNQKIFAQIQAHSDNAAATAVAGAALGIYSAAEADAMLKSALLEEQIRKQAAAWDGTAAGLQTMQSELMGYIANLNNMPSLIETEVRTNYTSSGSPSGYTPPGEQPQAMAQGGVVRGGIPGRDSVPALLMPGERVLTVAQNREFEQGRGGGGSPVTVHVYPSPGMNEVQLANMVSQRIASQLRGNARANR